MLAPLPHCDLGAPDRSLRVFVIRECGEAPNFFYMPQLNVSSRKRKQNLRNSAQKNALMPTVPPMAPGGASLGLPTPGGDGTQRCNLPPSASSAASARSQARSPRPYRALPCLAASASRRASACSETCGPATMSLQLCTFSAVPEHHRSIPAANRPLHVHRRCCNKPRTRSYTVPSVSALPDAGHRLGALGRGQVKLRPKRCTSSCAHADHVATGSSSVVLLPRLGLARPSLGEPQFPTPSPTTL